MSDLKIFLDDDNEQLMVSLPAVPRVGETVIVGSPSIGVYEVLDVTWVSTVVSKISVSKVVLKVKPKES